MGAERVTQCPSCGEGNRFEAKFCQECGTPLSRTCPECNAPLRPTARFCDSCGHRLEFAAVPVAAFGSAALEPRSYTPEHLAEKILRQRGDLEGERRTVTVLFADAVGSTPLAERLGEEGMYTLMQGCLARMMEAVHHYEGHVASFTGDGVMAVFGAPIAHEESERRAVAAALRMQRALEEYARSIQGVGCRFRVGLNTGPVVVGKVSDELTMEFTAVGDTVNLAARMEQTAEPGAVYLTEATHRPVADFFDCEAIGPQPVKGKEQPVQVYRAVREKPRRSRFQVAAERGLAPFVGRADDLATLERRLGVAREGRGQVVFLFGEAGIGKSRLLLEFRRRAMETGATWLEGHCISYGRDIPYLPLIEVVKGAFGVEEGDDEAAVVQRLEEGGARWNEAARSTTPYLRYLLSVDAGDAKVMAMEPRERRAGILDGLRALLVQESRGGPLVVTVEDLQWIDETSEQALGALVDVVASVPVLLLLTARPGYTKVPERMYVTRLVLEPLGAKESYGLVHGVLGASPPADLERLVADKAEGNPFYVEEVVRSLLETGVLTRSNGSWRLERAMEDILIPGSIQEVVLSRIDRLDRPAKEALQLASVIGREFTLRLLERISDLEAHLEEVLGELKAIELVYEKAYFPELAYMFKHALTHDVAYSTLLGGRRQVLHRVVAEAVEELYADRLAEHYETLAHHYFHGGERERALDYLARAGDKAAAAFANQHAVDYYGRALDIAEELGELTAAASLAHRRAGVNASVGRFPDAIADLDRMLAAGRQLGDRGLEGTALAYRGWSELWNHQPEKTEATLLAAIAVAGEDLVAVRALASMFLAGQYLVSNRHAEAGPLLAYAETHVAELDAFGRAVWGFLSSRVALWAGQLDEALRRADEFRPVTEAVTSLRLIARWTEAHALGTKGEYEAALRLLEETLATCERVSDLIIRVRCLNTIGYVYGELQDLERALEWNQRGLEMARAIPAPNPEVEINALINLGENFLALGRIDDAEAHFRPVEEVVRHPGPQWMRWRYAQRFLHSFGEYRLARGDTDAALALASECLAMAEASDSRKNIVKARRLRGEARLAANRIDEAGDDLAVALELSKEVGSPPQSWKTYMALGHLRLAQERIDEARIAFADALAVVDQVTFRLTNEELRATFVASREVQTVRRAAGGT